MKQTIVILMMVFTNIALALSAPSSLQSLTMLHFDEKSIVKPDSHLHTDLPETYRFILFFSNQCPHCIRFAPVLKAYADSHHWSIEAITLNGESLPEFPHATFATQEMIDVAYQGKTVTYPALFIANTKTHALYPVSFGDMSALELDERMNAIREKMNAYEEH